MHRAMSRVGMMVGASTLTSVQGGPFDIGNAERELMHDGIHCQIQIDFEKPAIVSKLTFRKYVKFAMADKFG